MEQVIEEEREDESRNSDDEEEGRRRRQGKEASGDGVAIATRENLRSAGASGLFRGGGEGPCPTPRASCLFCVHTPTLGLSPQELLLQFLPIVL